MLKDNQEKVNSRVDSEEEMFPRIAAIKAMEAGDGGRGADQLEAGQQLFTSP